jgi:hypothetical protein
MAAKNILPAALGGSMTAAFAPILCTIFSQSFTRQSGTGG